VTKSDPIPLALAVGLKIDEKNGVALALQELGARQHRELVRADRMQQ
jgi:hypothetical protein